MAGGKERTIRAWFGAGRGIFQRLNHMRLGFLKIGVAIGPQYRVWPGMQVVSDSGSGLPLVGPRNNARR